MYIGEKGVYKLTCINCNKFYIARMQGTENLFGYEGQGIASGEKGLSKVGSIVVEKSGWSAWLTKGGSWKNGGIVGGWQVCSGQRCGDDYDLSAH